MRHTDLRSTAALVLVQAETRLVHARINLLFIVQVLNRATFVVAPRPHVLLFWGKERIVGNRKDKRATYHLNCNNNCEYYHC